MSKSIYLFIASLLIIGLFFAIPLYNNWLRRSVLFSSISVEEQLQHLDPEDRRAARYGNSYLVFMQAVSAFHRLGISNPVILLPPEGFLTSHGCFNVESVEPALFYYFTGYKAVLATSAHVSEARWALVPGKNGAMLRGIESKQDLDTLVKSYLQFKPNQ